MLSTGSSAATPARSCRVRHGLPTIAGFARGVLAEMEERLDQMRSNLEVVDRYQAQVFERQLEAEAAQLGSFVSDRAFCNLAYAAHHSTILSNLAQDPRLGEYMASVREGLVFFIRPHRELLAEDGVRAGLAWEDVLRIDGMVKLLLELFAIPYIPVESLAMQERVRLVESVLALTDIEPRDAPRDAGERRRSGARGPGGESAPQGSGPADSRPEGTASPGMSVPPRGRPGSPPRRGSSFPAN